MITVKIRKMLVTKLPTLLNTEGTNHAHNVEKKSKKSMEICICNLQRLCNLVFPLGKAFITDINFEVRYICSYSERFPVVSVCTYQMSLEAQV